MNEAANYFGKGLTIYAPPNANRPIKLSAHRTWNSVADGVVFFETSSYGDFTNGKWIMNLLQELARETATNKIGLRVDPLRFNNIPPWFSGVQIASGVMTAQFSVTDLERLRDFYNSEASCETWSFFGLEIGCGAAVVFESLLCSLNAGSANYRFLVEVDLDGTLVGFVRPNQNIQSIRAMASVLSAIRTNDR